MNLFGPMQRATSIRTVRASTIAVAEDIPDLCWRDAKKLLSPSA